MVVVTMQLAPWHWQEKCEPRDPEEAHRLQLLQSLQNASSFDQIEKKISFAKWLQQKKIAERRRNKAIAAKQEEEREERAAKEREKKESERRQREDAKKQKADERRKAKALGQKREAINEKAKSAKAKQTKVNRFYSNVMTGSSKVNECKISFSHDKVPTFHEWMVRKKRDARRQNATQKEHHQERHHGPQHRMHDGKTAEEAYDAWIARKRLEDRVKQQRRKDEEFQRALHDKLLHAKTWQKKAIVCAYSRNQLEKEKARPALNHYELLY